MANVIDSLVVLLGLDPTNFTAGQKKVIEDLKKLDQTQREMARAEAARLAAMTQQQRAAEREKDRVRQAEERKARESARAKEKAETEAAKRQGEAYTLAKEAALGFGAALAALGVEKLVQGVSQSVAQVGLLSKNLDSSTPAVTAWGRAVERSVGGSAEAARGTLQKVTQDLIHMRMNLTIDNPLFYLANQLGRFSKSGRGFNWQGANGKPLDAQGILTEIASYAPEIDRAQYSTLLADAGFDAGSANLLAEGPRGVQAAMEWQLKNGLPTDQQADQALKVVNAEKGLEQAFDNLKNNLVLSFGPDIERFLKDLTSLIHFLTQDIDFDQLKKERKQHWHEAEVESLMNRGMSAEDAEKAAADADAKGIDATTGLTPGKIVKKLASAAVSYARDKNWLVTPVPPDVQAEIEKDAKLHGIDPRIALALFKTEGGGYNKVNPTSGAFGPAQLMPATAAAFGIATSVNSPDYDWRQNVNVGMMVLAQLLTRYHGKYALAEAGYDNRLDNPGLKYFAETGDPSQLLPETKGYLSTISSLLPAGIYMDAPYNFHDPNPGPGPVSHHNSSEVHINTVNVHGVNTNNVHAVAGGIQSAVRLGPLTIPGEKGLF